MAYVLLSLAMPLAKKLIVENDVIPCFFCDLRAFVPLR